MGWRKHTVNLSDEHKKFVAILARSGFYGRSEPETLEYILGLKVRMLRNNNLQFELKPVNGAERHAQISITIHDALLELVQQNNESLDDIIAHCLVEEMEYLNYLSFPARRGLTKDKATLTR